MKTNCECLKEVEEWSFEKQLGCWYVVRECDTCGYYWEGPDYSKTNKSVNPESGTINQYQHGQYGSPVKLDAIADVYNFCELNKFSHKEIRVVEPVEDAIVIQVIDGKYLFPEEWKKFNEN